MATTHTKGSNCHLSLDTVGDKTSVLIKVPDLNAIVRQANTGRSDIVAEFGGGSFASGVELPEGYWMTFRIGRKTDNGEAKASTRSKGRKA